MTLERHSVGSLSLNLNNVATVLSFFKEIFILRCGKNCQVCGKVARQVQRTLYCSKEMKNISLFRDIKRGRKRIVF